jgi:acetyl esterase/lipase
MRIKLATLCLTLTAILAAADSPPARSGPTRPINITPGGPAIPATPAVESTHPASIPLWSDGAPGSEARKSEPEEISWRQESDIVFPVLSNVHQPSLTPFLPAKDKATGCAVIIAPGGGHMQHTIDREGYDLARWFADRGIACLLYTSPSPRD